MTYTFEFSDAADGEIDAILLYLMRVTPTRVRAWQDGLEKAADSLRQFPNRCPLALEGGYGDQEVRYLAYGPYRLLFIVVDSDGDGENDLVRILHVRHAAHTGKTSSLSYEEE